MELEKKEKINLAEQALQALTRAAEKARKEDAQEAVTLDRKAKKKAS